MTDPLREALILAANEGRNVLTDATDDQAATIEAWAGTALADAMTGPDIFEQTLARIRAIHAETWLTFRETQAILDRMKRPGRHEGSDIVTDPLTKLLDRHWLHQGITTGTAYCTCGGWGFDAMIGQEPPTLGERFEPFSQHVADAIRAAGLMEDAGLPRRPRRRRDGVITRRNLLLVGGGAAIAAVFMLTGGALAGQAGQTVGWVLSLPPTIAWAIYIGWRYPKP